MYVIHFTVSKREPDIIGDVMDELSKRASDAGVRLLPEEGLLAQIDRSLAQAERGEARDAEEFEAEFS